MAIDGKTKGWKKKQEFREPATREKIRGKVNLRAEDFDTLVDQQGVRVKVYRTMFCPNVKSVDGGEHNIDCQLCQGNEWLDVSPLCTVAFLQTQDLEKLHKAEGYWDANTVSATFLQGVEVQYFTLVELLDHTDIFFQRIKRSRGDIDRLKYTAKCVNALIDAQGNTYEAGADFELTEDYGDIRWLDGRGPGRDVIYSVHYDALVQFRATKAMHVNRFAQIQEGAEIVHKKMNEQWQLTKEYLVDRKNAQGDSLNPNLLRDEDGQEIP